MKTWRAKHYILKLTDTRKLAVSVRRFKTSKANRSQSYRQVVFPLDFGGIKEIAIRLQTQKRRSKRSPKTAQFWHFQASFPLVLVVIGLAGSGFFGSRLVSGQALEPVRTFSAPTKMATTPKATPATTKPPESLAYSVPTHIAIPSVGIDADITPVGQASDGSIEMPPILDWITGWYKYSPTPGQIGPAVIVGHVDNYQNISVFWRLRYVQPGDIVTIDRTDGSTVQFKITALEQFDQSNFPTAAVYGNTADAELRLITCGGTFNTQTSSYDQNTVVYATLQ
jgi:hypothetical protein